MLPASACLAKRVPVDVLVRGPDGQMAFSRRHFLDDRSFINVHNHRVVPVQLVVQQPLRPMQKMLYLISHLEAQSNDFWYPNLGPLFVPNFWVPPLFFIIAVPKYGAKKWPHIWVPKPVCIFGPEMSKKMNTRTVCVSGCTADLVGSFAYLIAQVCRSFLQKRRADAAFPCNRSTNGLMMLSLYPMGQSPSDIVGSRH